MAGYSTVILPDGAKLAYEVLGSQHLGHKQPLVLVCGMSHLRGDWERLSNSLARNRPVLLYDHRGIGDSSYSTTTGDDELTIESLARDLLFLIGSLGWQDISICGFSMGGVVAQQLLLLPYLPSRPVTLPFRTTHLFLAATRSAVLQDKRLGLRYTPAPPTKPRTPAERKQVARVMLESTFDPKWLGANGPRLESLVDRVISGSYRPPATIMKQSHALQTFDFINILDQLPRDTQILVIHGQADQLIPFQSGQEILRHIPWAQLVKVGNLPGQVPTLDFGHHWFEYFDIQVWHDVLEVFLEGGNADNQ